MGRHLGTNEAKNREVVRNVNISSGCLLLIYMLSINVDVLCVMRIGFVIVGINPDDINESNTFRVGL